MEKLEREKQPRFKRFEMAAIQQAEDAGVDQRLAVQFGEEQRGRIEGLEERLLPELEAWIGRFKSAPDKYQSEAEDKLVKALVEVEEYLLRMEEFDRNSSSRPFLSNEAKWSIIQKFRDKTKDQLLEEARAVAQKAREKIASAL